MTTATKHARRSPLARFAALFRYDDDRPARPGLQVGMPGTETAGPAPHISADVQETLARLREQAEAETQQAPPWYGYSTPARDNPPVHDRPYVPAADGKALPPVPLTETEKFFY